MSEWRRAFSYLLGGVLVLSLAACGGSGTDPTPLPTPTPQPTPPPPEVVSQGSAEIDVLVLYVIPFSTSRAGSLTATVDWTFSQNDLDVYIAQGNCSFDQFVAQQCNVVGFSESFTAKPERVSVATAAAGSYTLFVGNVGPDAEAFSFQVVLTPSASARATETTPGQSLMSKGPPRGFVELR